MIIRAARAAVLFLALLATAAASTAERAVVVVGDSLSAAYGLRADEGWVTLLAERLDAAGVDARVVNAAISGDTTRGGRTRLPALLERFAPGDVVVLELGGNDGLRGVALGETERNLDAMVATALERDMQVVLVGMQLPPNLGPVYTRAFAAIFPRVAERHAVTLVPFLLDGVALQPELMQDDGIHPTAAAQPHLLDNVWPHLRPLL